MNRLIVVTGGTKGIGKAIIEKFASAGFDTVTCSRNKKDLESLQQAVQAKFSEVKVLIKKSDLSKKEEAFAFAKYVNGLNRPVDVLVNNTGFFIPGTVHEEEDGALEAMINTNLYSAYHVTRGLIGAMKDRKEGHVFNICSVASITAYPNGGSYSISKFAMYGMSKALREEMKEHGVRVTAILPGATLTASWEGVELPPERFVKSSDVAEAIFNANNISQQSVIEDIIIRPQLGDI